MHDSTPTPVTPPTPTHDQTPLLLDDREPSRYLTSPIKLDVETVRDGEILLAALEGRLDDLKGLAKKNLAEGYASAARAQNGDVAIIKTRFLPQLGQQLTLRAESPLPINDRVRRAFKFTIEAAMRRVAEEAIRHPDNAEHRYEVGRELVEDLADRITRFAGDLYDAAYHAGISERRNTFARLVDAAAVQLEL